MDRDQFLTRGAVEALIADGQAIVIFEDVVLRLDGWLDKHPGGRLAILHMVGTDATDPMSVYHSAETLKTMKAYRIGRKPAGLWRNFTPPIDGGVFRKQPEDAAQTPEPRPEVEDYVDNESVASSSSTESCSDGASSRTSGSIIGGDVAPEALKPPAQDVEGGLLLPALGAAAGIRRRDLRRGDADKGGVLADSGSASTIPLTTDDQARAAGGLTRDTYTELAVQQGVNRSVWEYPSVDEATQQHIVEKYRALHQKLKDDGLYNCPYMSYAKEAVRYSILFALFAVALHHGWYITSAVFLGLFWHQLMFTAHDAGHLAITSNFVVDTLIGMFIADFCCGLSIGWWKSSHNVHHLVTNQTEHDPDIQNVPLFATCPSFFRSIHSSYYDFTFVWDAAADFLVPYQKYTYYPIMGIARFNLYLLSWIHVLSAKSTSLGQSRAWWIRPGEMVFMSCYWFLFGYCLLWRTLPDWPTRVAFVLASHVVTMPLHVQITLSHWGMSTANMGPSESFAQRQLRTTMDVDCPAWLDFIHGGLQFQAVHHLFPRVPRHNLRKVQALVRGFCKETGIPYSILGFMDGNKKVLGRLDEVGSQVRILISCQKSMAVTGESGLH